MVEDESKGVEGGRMCREEIGDREGSCVPQQALRSMCWMLQCRITPWVLARGRLALSCLLMRVLNIRCSDGFAHGGTSTAALAALEGRRVAVLTASHLWSRPMFQASRTSRA